MLLGKKKNQQDRPSETQLMMACNPDNPQKIQIATLSRGIGNTSSHEKGYMNK